MESRGTCSSCGATLPSDGTLAEVCVACALELALDRSGDEDATVAPERVTSEPSRIIGPYRLVQKIGEGGMGEVWQAEQTEPVRRRVAIKVIKLGMDTKQVIARFEAERQALAMMDHACVSKVLDAGATPEGRPYFVMEYVSGVPITEHCDSHRLTTGERLALFMQVCDGVQHAHQKAIIHRDLKPSNVLVSIQDGVAVPKIIDFGVAKATEQKLTEKSLFTEIGVLIGTPEYMSPEQADLTVQDVDTRTDVYALGVMLYELLAGALPFESKALREAGLEGIRRMIREVEPPKPSTRLSTLGGERSAETARHRRVDLSTLRRQLTGELDWITMKALEKDRAHRYASPAELAADLKRHVRNEPVLAGPPSAAYRARKFVRRHRFGVAAAAVGILALAGFAVAMAAQAQRIAREAESKRRVSEFLTELFEVSDPSEARGNNITARELLDKGSARVRGTLGDDLKVRADLMMTMGVVYRNLGLYPQAEPLLKEALETRRRVLGGDNPETLRLASETARLYLRQGRTKEAEPLVRETLDRQKRVLGPDHPDTLRSMSDLANADLAQGRFKEAEARLRETLDIQKRVLGPEHPDSLDSMSELARAYFSQGRDKEAEALTRETLDIRKRVLGPAHPGTLKAMSDLAGVHFSQGRNKEGEALLRESLDIRKRVLGAEHPDTLKAMSDLARMYPTWKGADAAIRELLDIRKRVLGPEHPDVMASMIQLGNNLFVQGRNKEAQALYRETLDVRKRVLGAEHRDTLKSIASLANTYWAEDRFKEAETLYRESLDVWKRVLGPEHPDTLRSMGNLAGIYSSQGRYKEAETLSLETLELEKRVLGPEHWERLRELNNLASVYQLQRRFKEAETLFAETLEISTRVLGPEHLSTLDAMNGLGFARVSQGRLEEAEALQLRALEIGKRVFGPEFPSTLDALFNLACIGALKGERSEALSYLRDAVEHGYSRGKKLLEDANLKSLRGDPEFKKIVAIAKVNQARGGRTQ